MPTQPVQRLPHLIKIPRLVLQVDLTRDCPRLVVEPAKAYATAVRTELIQRQEWRKTHYRIFLGTKPLKQRTPHTY